MPRMSLASWADADRDAQQAVAADRRAEFDAVRMADYQQKRQQRQVLNDLYRQYGGDEQAIAAAAPVSGLDAERAMSLRDRARQAKEADTARELKEIELVEAVADEAEQVYDQDTYSRWLAKASEVAKLTGAKIPNIPPTYDAKYFDGIRANARKQKAEAERQKRLLTADEVAKAGYAPGSVVQEDIYSGAQDVTQSPPKPAKLTLKEVYDPDSPSGSRWLPAEQAAGMPGKPVGGEDPREQRVVEWMVESGIASDPDDAWNKFTQAKTNPVKFAADMARAELPSLSTEAPDPVALERRVKHWTEVARELAGQARPKARGTVDDPVPVTSREEAARLPPGTYFRRPDGKTMRVPAR